MRHRPNAWRHVPVAFAAAILGFAAEAVAEDSNSRTIAPSHVFVAVSTFRSELEELRFKMGSPKNRQPEMKVEGAAPREVYFQALTMFQKADRLCFEHTRERTTPPELPKGDITPSHVYDVVGNALQCLRQVRNNYGLEEQSTPDARDDTKQPTDVFRSIVQANRQLNLMLDRRFAPSDVFEQVTRAVGYTSRLLETFPGAVKIPDEPPNEAGKQPADVYRRLLGCIERIRRIAHGSGLEMLELQIAENQIQQAEPSDVFDIASLVVAELAYLHSKQRDAKTPREVYYVGRKFPSHVYQRAGILDRQLIELEHRVKANRGWLKREPTDK